MPQDVLAYLRQVTSVQHERLEKQMEAQRAHFTELAYARYLACMLRLYETVEGAQAPFFKEMIPKQMQWAERSKVAWLKTDLATLVQAPSSGSQVSVLSPSAFSISDRDVAWGAAYVTEGSTLGGQILYRTLAPTLRVPSRCEHRFWRGHERATGPLWKLFVATLRQEVVGDEAIERAGIGATRAFALFLGGSAQAE